MNLVFERIPNDEVDEDDDKVVLKLDVFWPSHLLSPQVHWDQRSHWSVSMVALFLKILSEADT